jgi:hypothetical protein
MIWRPPPSPVRKFVYLSQSSCVSPVELADGRGGGRGWARSQTIRRRESLVLFSKVNTLWTPKFSGSQQHSKKSIQLFQTRNFLFNSFPVFFLNFTFVLFSFVFIDIVDRQGIPYSIVYRTDVSQCSGYGFASLCQIEIQALKKYIAIFDKMLAHGLNLV